MSRSSETMIQRVRCGDLLAEVTVDLRPREGKDYDRVISLEDALKVERVKRALESGDLAKAATEARLYLLMPVSAA